MPVLKNQRHERFAQELAKGKSATDAYLAAGYTGKQKSLHEAASRLSRSVKVQSRVTEIQQRGAERAEVTVERVIRELAKIGFSDIRKLVKWRSNATVVGEDPDTGADQMRAFNEVEIVDSSQIDDDTAGAISEVSQTKEGTLKVKLHDKQAALVTIGKHLGMFTEKVEHSGAVALTPSITINGKPG